MFQIFFENNVSNLRNFLVPPLLILNKKRIVLILAMYENTGRFDIGRLCGPAIFVILRHILILLIEI